MIGCAVTSWERGGLAQPPTDADRDGDDLVVIAAHGSDFRQRTSYGFRRDSGHALLEPLIRGRAVEVTFVADARGAFEQAAVLVRLDETPQVKAGAEHSDGVLQCSAVVTAETSDWSAAPVPDWADRSVTVRASLSDDAVTIRARIDEEPFRLVRLAPLGAGQVLAGPYCCAPETDGFGVRFTRWSQAVADRRLH